MRHFITWLALWFFGAVGTVAQVAVPPQLIRPIQGAQLPSPLVQFEWTPSSPSAPGLVYRLTVKPRYQGQSPTQAMASNPVSLQVDVPGTSYQTSLSEANALGADAAAPNYAGHVWHVQALLNGLPYGDNQGFSQIEGFSVPAMAVDPVKPPRDLVGWDILYHELLRGGKSLIAELPDNASDTLIIALRVHMPQELVDEIMEILAGSTEQVQAREEPGSRGCLVPKMVHGYWMYVYSPSGGVQPTPRPSSGGGPKFTGYVLNQSVCSGAGRASGKTFRRLAPPQGRGPGIPIRPSDVGLPEFRTLPGDTLDYYAGGFYVYGEPDHTLVTDKEQETRSRYTGGFFVYRAPQDTLQTPHFTYTGGFFVYKEDSTIHDDSGIPLHQIAYNAGKEGAIIVEPRIRVVNATVKPISLISKKAAALVGGIFISTHLLLPICPIAIAEGDAFPEPLSDILVAVDEENGAVEYRWLALRKGLTKIQTTVRPNCDSDFYPIK